MYMYFLICSSKLCIEPSALVSPGSIDGCVYVCVSIKAQLSMQIVIRKVLKMSSSKFEVKALSEQCINHVGMHLEEYPSAYLALLPLRLRRRILWRLSMADACKLEDTQFVKDISMEEYWKSYFDVSDCFAFPDRSRSCINEYFEKKWRSGLSKAIVHGMLSSLCIGSFNLFHSGFGVSSDDISVAFSLMFGLRDEECIKKEVGWSSRGIIVPPRYQEYSLRSSKEELFSMILDVFLSDLPYFHMEHVEEAACIEVLKFIPRIRRSVRYFAIENCEFGLNVQDLIIRIARDAPKLEVLCLQYEPPYVDEDPTPVQSLDQILCELALSDFVSSMHLFMAYSRFHEADLDMERGYFRVSYNCLKLFLDALCKTTADHRQVLRLEGTAILCNNHQELRELLNFNILCKKAPVIEIYKCKYCVINDTL
jgi:hypothetical protein